MTDAIMSARQAVLNTCRSLVEKGYLVGTGGNVSMRVADEAAAESVVAITPSSRDYRTLSPEDICVVDLAGQVRAGTSAPSVETTAHLAVYARRPDVNAVIHTHQPYASTFTLIGRSIPALFDEQVANLGPEVKLVGYGISGSQEMTEQIVGGLENQCNAYLIQNHGVLCLGTTLAQAALNVELLEKVARVYYYALGTGQEISPLPAESTQVLFEMLKSEQRQEVRRKRKSQRA
jgi:glutamate-1-semialdehyde 2,1-aminomutase